MPNSVVVSVYNVVKELGPTVVSTIGVATAIQGLNTWRRQLHGTADLDLARRVLRGVYMMREALLYVRNPLIDGAEIAVAFEKKGLPVSRESIMSGDDTDKAVYDLRWEHVVTASHELNGLSIEAEAYWGSDYRQPLIAFRDMTFKLRNAILTHLRANQPMRRQMTERDLQAFEEAEDTLYSMTTHKGPDEFERQIDDWVRSVEEIIRPKMSSGTKVAKRK